MNTAAERVATPPAAVSFWQAFAYWLKLGFISFGGPTGQIAIMHQELVERKRWISEGRFLHALNYCMLLPGPEAQQLATYIGWLMHRTWGGIVAGGLFVLPSLFILIALSWIYMRFGDVPAVAALLYGIKPAVTAIVVFAAYRIGSRALKYKPLWLISVAAFVAIFAFAVPFPAIVLTAAIIGAIWGRLAPERFRGGGHGAAAKSVAPALIDDGMVLPHTRFSAGKVAVFAVVGLALWLAVLGALASAYGWQGTLTQIGWFFTKAALLTFGGAYAVLPYVYQGAVEHYGWLTRDPDDRRARARRNHAGSADHGGRVRRLRRRVGEGAVRSRGAPRRRRGRRGGRDVLHVPALVRVHPGRQRRSSSRPTATSASPRRSPGSRRQSWA